jgi:hypothetical protein
MKKLLLKIIILFSLTVLPLLAFNYIVDPLQCFRVAKWYAPLYDSNERVQSGCLARSHKYDTIIMGSSHVENIDSAVIDKVFGVSSIRLTVAASTVYEQNRVLNLALKTGQVKNVIWGLDTNILFDTSTRVRDDIVPFPSYIYEPNWYNNILFLLDPYIIKHYVKMLAHKFVGKYNEFTDLRTLNSWEQLFTFSEERVWQAYGSVKQGKMAAMQNTNEKLEVGDINNLSTENIDKNILDLIKANPQVNFTIYFPPYSILRFAQLYEIDQQKLAVEIKLKEYLVNKLLEQKNVQVFDFQLEKKITHDLNNYKDLTHYKKGVDAFIINALQGQKDRVIKDENRRYSFGAEILKQVEDFYPTVKKHFSE